MTERLYYIDCYQHEFQARVLETADGGRRVYLDRTAFYPTSGGQSFDTGTLGGAAIQEVIDEDGRIAHLLRTPLEQTEVQGRIDWARRFDHMQQHTGQHLLSAVLVELYGIRTLSFHMGEAVSTIELGSGSMDPSRIEQTEEYCAKIIAQARPVSITFEDASSELGLRKASERTGELRIVSIEGLDRSACGGTHVRSTAEIGPILIRKLDKVRGNVRLEFVCGLRALRQARRDFQMLSEVGATLSVAFEDAPGAVKTQAPRLKAMEKTLQRLAVELAQREGRELYASTAPDDQGVRRVTQRGQIDDAVRARAQAFVSGSKSIFLATSEDPPSVLLAVSPDSGIHAGDRLRAAVTAAGGRGGGNQTLAQGSVPSNEALQSVVESIG
jgi:alanyl-tRNA synthetase